MNCLFCQLINGKIPSHKVYEDEHTFAFLDINPAISGHTLVIPKKHYLNINDIPGTELCKVMSTVKKISEVLLKLNEGVNIIQNNGQKAGQIIEHLHFHIIPRNTNDQIKIEVWEPKKYSEDEITKTLNKLKDTLNQQVAVA